MLKIKEFHSELNAFEVYNLFKNQKNSILLDSSKEDKNLSKYSFIGINEFMIFETMQSKSLCHVSNIYITCFYIIF